MSTEDTSGHAHAWMEPAPGFHGHNGQQHNGHQVATGPASARSDRAPADTAELHRALAASQQQVGAALQQIDALVKGRDELLKQEVVRLGQALEQARRSAHYDQLTNLPNRGLLLDRFNQAAARGERQPKLVALLFLDLDGFKEINDALGHPAGDRLLQQVAARLTESIRKSDTACRYGGDEFVILLPELDCRESAVVAADKIQARLAMPYMVDGTTIEVTASIGIAVCPIIGSEFGDLIQQADAAMYRNKAHSPASPRVLAPRQAGPSRLVRLVT